jgi:rhodanese-related sulfurtransferase
MKRVLLFAGVFCASVALMGYGVSPQRAIQGGQFQPNPGQGSYGNQQMPAPLPSNNLAPGGPMAGVAPAIPPAVNTEPTIEANIRTYKPDAWAMAWGHITLEEAEKLHNDPTVLFADARSKQEYDQGHIPYAIPLPATDFEKYFAMYKSKIEHARKIVTYCHGIGCKLSDKCAQQLHDTHHLHNVSAFFGGWPQWNDAHLPIEVSTAPKPRS